MSSFVLVSKPAPKLLEASNFEESRRRSRQEGFAKSEQRYRPYAHTYVSSPHGPEEKSKQNYDCWRCAFGCLVANTRDLEELQNLLLIVGEITAKASNDADKENLQKLTAKLERKIKYQHR